MASGDNHQWGFHQYPQPSDHGAVQGGYLGHSFQRDGDDGSGSNANTNSFGLAHQWQTSQDNQFMQQNGFSYQPQGQAFSAQQFPAGSSHTQTHQHPQAFSGTMSLEGPKELSWDYSFAFETNQLTGLGEDGGSYGGVPNASHFSHAVPNTIAGQQPQHHQRQQPQQTPQQPHHQAQQPQQLPQQQQHPHPHQHQHQLNAGHPSGQVYTPGQVAGYGRNMQQPQPQSMAQSMSSRQTVEFQQSVASQHQQQQQQQPVVAQHQHQQPNPLQVGSRPNPQLQSLNQPQQISRVGTPQSMTSVNQARQSPFSGRAVPPMPMQQQGSHNQFPIQDTHSSPAVPFSVPQQTSMASTSANIPNNPTTQSRFMPPQLVAPQRPSQSPVTQTNAPALPNTMSKCQTDNQLMFQHALQSNAKPNSQLVSQHRVSTPTTAPTTAWLEQQWPGLEQPQVSRKDENAIPVCGSRYVSLGFMDPVQIDPDADENQTIHDVADPSEYAGLSFGNLFPSANGQPRILANQILQNWASALVQDDSAGQIEQERRLRQHFGE